MPTLTEPTATRAEVDEILEQARLAEFIDEDTPPRRGYDPLLEPWQQYRIDAQRRERESEHLNHGRIFFGCVAIGVVIIGGKALFDWLISIIGG